jgi:hypothetical protein
MPKGELFALVAAHIDREIHRNYMTFDTNRAALATLRGERDERFELFVRSRIDMVGLPQKDEAFLRDRLIEMYANPLINKLKAEGQE